eukprot:5237724-Prymnesium_polylepis.1
MGSRGVAWGHVGVVWGSRGGNVGVAWGHVGSCGSTSAMRRVTTPLSKRSTAAWKGPWSAACPRIMHASSRALPRRTAAAVGGG